MSNDAFAGSCCSRFFIAYCITHCFCPFFAVSYLINTFLYVEMSCSTWGENDKMVLFTGIDSHREIAFRQYSVSSFFKLFAGKFSNTILSIFSRAQRTCWEKIEKQIPHTRNSAHCWPQISGENLLSQTGLKLCLKFICKP